MNRENNNNKEYKKALNSAYRFLARRDHSIYELRQKLLRKNFDGQVIDSVINRLLELDYLDDLEFARSFIRHCQKIRQMGPVRIFYELRKRGVSREIIDISSDEYSEDLEKDIILKIILSKLELGKREDKIIQYLQRKGFYLEKILNYMKLARVQNCEKSSG